MASNGLDGGAQTPWVVRETIRQVQTVFLMLRWYTETIVATPIWLCVYRYINITQDLSREGKDGSNRSQSWEGRQGPVLVVQRMRGLKKA